MIQAVRNVVVILRINPYLGPGPDFLRQGYDHRHLHLLRVT